MQVTPKINHNPSALHFTTLPLHCFQKLQNKPFPFEWKFWKNRSLDDFSAYPGAVFYLNVQGTPFLDVLKWDHMAACVGFLPDSFNVFLHCLGVSLSNCSRINRQLVQILRSHTYRIFKTYWKMHRDILTATRGVRRSS